MLGRNGNTADCVRTPRTVPTPEIRAKAHELTCNAQTETEKIQAIFDYVSTTFRYIGISLGIGRYQPHKTLQKSRRLANAKGRYCPASSLNNLRHTIFLFEFSNKNLRVSLSSLQVMADSEVFDQTRFRPIGRTFSKYRQCC